MAVIEVQNLTKQFGDVRAVDGISFSVEKGEIFGFLGPNGAGKSTTIRCMMDFLRPTSGSVKLLGRDAQKDAVSLKHQIGYLSGYVQLYDNWAGQQHIDVMRSLNGEVSVAAELVERLEFNPQVKTRKLSSGNKQKLGLILALMNKPDVLIFDEPTNALDPLMQNTVYELLREASERGATVFMSSHNLREVEKICSRVGVIKQGKMVAEESVRELKQKRLYTVHVVLQDSKTLCGQASKLEGVEAEKVTDGATLSVKGDIAPVLELLTKHSVQDVEILHASLEDIFLEFYE